MEEPVVDQVPEGEKVLVEISPEDAKRISDENFEAGRSKARASLQGEAPAEEKPEEIVPPEPVKIAGLTPEELQDAVTKARQYDSLKEELASTTRKINGKIGDLNRQLIGRGAPREVRVEDLGGMNEAFPEMAEILAKDLSKLALESGGKGLDPAAIEEIVNSKLTETLEEAKLDIWHPDWRDTVNSKDLFGWMSEKKTPEEIEEFQTSVSAKTISKYLKEFDQHQATIIKAEADKAELERKKREKAEKNKQRLEGAITPTGAGSEVQGKKIDAFEEGRKKARERRKNL